MEGRPIPAHGGRPGWEPRGEGNFYVLVVLGPAVGKVRDLEELHVRHSAGVVGNVNAAVAHVGSPKSPA